MRRSIMTKLLSCRKTFCLISGSLPRSRPTRFLSSLWAFCLDYTFHIVWALGDAAVWSEEEDRGERGLSRAAWQQVSPNVCRRIGVTWLSSVYWDAAWDCVKGEGKCAKKEKKKVDLRSAGWESDENVGGFFECTPEKEADGLRH